MKLTPKGRRVAAFYGMHLIYFPLLIGGLWILTLLRHQLAWHPPDWLHVTLTFAIAAGLYIGLGYAVARRLDRSDST
jgi:uncharacterized membrane protein SirB2